MREDHDREQLNSEQRHAKNKLMRFRYSGRIGEALDRDGLFVALFICFCVVAFCAVFTVKTNLENIGLNRDYNSVDLNDSIAKMEQGQAEAASQGKAVDESAETKANTQEESSVVSSNPLYVKPVEGKLITPYSQDVPIYSETLDQFVTHGGIDIAAPMDTPVVSVKDGIVTRVYNDDTMGISIIIQHDDGMVAKYCNLSTDRMVQEGDVVKAGDTISGVGSTALFESLSEPHLHFELSQNETSLNPQTYLQY